MYGDRAVFFSNTPYVEEEKCSPSRLLLLLFFKSGLQIMCYHFIRW